MAYRSRSFVLPGPWLALAVSAQNTTTDVVAGWQAGPNQRGTLNLTVLHLNVPGLRDSAWKRAVRKVKWMVINVLFPEFIFSKAVCDLRQALLELRELDQDLRGRDSEKVAWTDHYSAWKGAMACDHEVCWVVEYPRRAGLLYHLLGLKRPSPQPDDEGQVDAEGGSADPAPQRSEYVATRDAAKSDADFQFQEHLLHDNSAEEASGNLHGTHKPSPGEVPTGSAHLERSRPGSEPQDPSLTYNGIQPGTSDGLRYTSEQGRSGDLEAPEVLQDPKGSSSESLCEGENDGPETGAGTSTPLRVPKVRRTTQKWTVVHSYCVQMGGIVYPYLFSDDEGSDGGQPTYRTLTTSRMTGESSWWSPSDLIIRKDHALKRLCLTENDIQDKSKADWLAKGLAVVQITWLVLDVAVRGITGLPVTQLEIATIAFAVMAVAIYLANWWKPKDVSQPTILPALSWETAHMDREKYDHTKQFMLRLWSPHEAEKRARTMPDLERVPNDTVWMEGGTPLVFVVMAASSLMFGGLHCLAWDFEFPTRTEQICWRIASLTSAILPVITLGISLFLNYLSTTYVDQRYISTLLSRLKPLEQLPPAWWQLLMEPTFEHWEHDAIVAMASMPRELRNWEEPPSKEAIERARASEEWNKSVAAMLDNYGPCCWDDFGKFRIAWLDALSGNYTRPAKLLQDWSEAGDSVQSWRTLWDGKVLDLWRDYEDFVRRKLQLPATALRNGISCLEHMGEAYDETLPVLGPGEMGRMEAWQRACGRASTVLTIGSGIVYTAARLMIMVLLFTSLRAVPAGVYDDTPWTRFLPSFS